MRLEIKATEMLLNPNNFICFREQTTLNTSAEKVQNVSLGALALI